MINHPYLEVLRSRIAEGPTEEQDEHDGEEEGEEEGTSIPDELSEVRHEYAAKGFQSLILFPVNFRKTSSSVAWRTDSSDSSADLWEAMPSSPEMAEGMLLV